MKYFNNNYELIDDENDEYNSEEFCHHGILGQKWGIRRYQNADGTLTEAGKKQKIKLDKKKLKKEYRKELKDIQRLRKKSVYKMTPSELDARLEDLNKQKQVLSVKNEISQLRKKNTEKTNAPKKSFLGQTFESIQENAARRIGEATGDKIKDILRKRLSSTRKLEYERTKEDAEYWVNKNKISKAKFDMNVRANKEKTQYSTGTHQADPKKMRQFRKYKFGL